jgi:ubiquinone biosynthesis protein UbiJ
MSSAHFQQQPSSLAYFWLNSLESLLNAFVDLDPATRNQLTQLDGIVVRVKTFAPYQVFYLLFTTQGIEVSPKPQGDVQIRLSGKVRDLVWTLLGLESEQHAESKGHLHLWGETTLLQQLRHLLQEFNLRSAAAHWIKTHLPINTLWQKLTEQDLSWLRDLQPIPALIKQTRAEIAALNAEVQAQKTQLATLEKLLGQQIEHTRTLLTLTKILIVCSVGLIGLSIGIAL